MEAITAVLPPEYFIRCSLLPFDFFVPIIAPGYLICLRANVRRQPFAAGAEPSSVACLVRRPSGALPSLDCTLAHQEIALGLRSANSSKVQFFQYCFPPLVASVRYFNKLVDAAKYSGTFCYFVWP